MHLLQSKYRFKGHASTKGTDTYAKGLAGTVGVNHFSKVSWGPEDLQKPDDAGNSQTQTPTAANLSAVAAGFSTNSPATVRLEARNPSHAAPLHAQQ